MRPLAFVLALGVLVAAPAGAADLTCTELGAHPSHTQTGRVHGKLSCEECHAAACSAATTPRVVFGALARSGSAAPVWNGATRTCSNVYCHGTASPVAWTWSDPNTVRPPSVECALCHGNPPASPHPQTGDCRACHSGTLLADGTVDVAGGKHLNGQLDFSGGAGGASCAACHRYPPSTGAHVAHFGLADAATGASYADTSTLEERFPSAPPGTAYAFGCATCHSVDATRHLNGSNDVVLFEVAAPAGSLKARAAPSAAYSAASGTCSGVYCHAAGAGAPGWRSGVTLGCNGCHGTTTPDGRPDYATGTPKANSHALHAYGCATCHAGTTADGTTLASAALHVNGRLDVAPGAGASFTYAYASTGGTCSNVSCHFGGSAKWGASESHLAALGSGEVLVFEDGNMDHGPGFGITEDCTSCHAQSLKTQHAGRCDLCHGAGKPVSLLAGGWDRSCSQAACHTSIHAGGLGSDHHGMWQNSSSACARCHDTSGGSFPGPGDNCSRCHAPALTAAAVGDHAPPATTSDAVATYVGGASIHLTAVDAGTAGVSVTWFSLDGKAWTVGTELSVAAPASGTRAHTLSFYSTDHARNAEAVHTIAFTVQAKVTDTTPPTTTSSFNPAAGAILNAAQPVTLTATDAGSGVKATYFRIDGGAFTPGTSFTVSGEGLHTFGFYSQDNALNTEAAHASNSFRIDTIAPVTTATAAAGATYTGSQTFTLSATDGGSGVASTWYRLDAGAWIAGVSIPVAAPASGSASHTLAWYSKDVATNTEATHSVGFTVQAPADVSPPTTLPIPNPAPGAIYNAPLAITLTATDAGGSGVKASYHKVDAAAFAQGSSFTVSGDGLHSFSYYSVDSALNAEVVRSSSVFRIDTIAPVTTASAAAGATYPGSQTFTLSAADAGSGVAGTWYRLDAGAWTAGTSVAVAAPASGSASHTLAWYSKDLATNTESTRSVTFTVTAAAAAGTARISFRTLCSGISGYVWAYWQVRDAGGTPIDGLEFSYDDCGHPASMWADFEVPSGAGYELYGEFSDNDSGEILDSATRTVTPAEAAPGATVVWWFH